MKNIFTFICIMLILNISSLLAGNFYVDNSATGNDDGTSWTDAYLSLQAALDIAVSGDEIWVAAGTYIPSKETDGTTDEPVNFTFQMIQGVEIYGGFTGNETATNQRTDFGEGGVNETILSGDHSNNDNFDAANGGYQSSTGDDNCNNIFANYDGLGLTTTAILDGFTITGAKASAIYNSGASPTLRNLIIKNNSSNQGGGIYNISFSNPSLNNVTISYNVASNYGGGIYNSNSFPSFDNVNISHNYASEGGGLYISSSNINFKNATISSNSSNSWGGAFSVHQSTISFTNALITNNNASNGAGFYSYNSNKTFYNVTLAKNTAASYGGGMYESNSAFNYTNNFYNSIIWGNIAGNGKQFYLNKPTTNLYYSCYESGFSNGQILLINAATFNPDANCITIDPQFHDFANNDFTIKFISPCLDEGNDAYNSETYDIRGVGFSRKLLRTDHTQVGTIDMGAYEFKEGTDGTAPTVTTTSISNIDNNSADGGGTVVLGPDASAVTEHGVCWNTTGTPDTDDSITTQGANANSTFSFSSELNGLTANQVYYVRAYITNSIGTFYGNEVSFATIPTLGEWGLIVLGSLFAIGGGWLVWRRIA